MLDLYIDEAKHPLPWRISISSSDWSNYLNSGYFLKAYEDTSGTDSFIPAARYKKRITLHPFMNHENKKEAVYVQKNFEWQEAEPGLTLQIMGYKQKAIEGLTIVTLKKECTPFKAVNKKVEPIFIRLQNDQDTLYSKMPLLHSVTLPISFINRSDVIRNKANEEVMLQLKNNHLKYQTNQTQGENK